MADGREYVADVITQLTGNKGKIVGVYPAGAEAVDKMIEGFNSISKKFYLKTQAGTEAAKECVDLFNEVIAAVDNGGDVAAKFEAFAGPSNTFITTAANLVIRMT